MRTPLLMSAQRVLSKEEAPRALLHPVRRRVHPRGFIRGAERAMPLLAFALRVPHSVPSCHGQEQHTECSTNTDDRVAPAVVRRRIRAVSVRPRSIRARVGGCSTRGASGNSVDWQRRIEERCELSGNNATLAGVQRRILGTELGCKDIHLVGRDIRQENSADLGWVASEACGGKGLEGERLDLVIYIQGHWVSIRKSKAHCILTCQTQCCRNHLRGISKQLSSRFRALCYKHPAQLVRK
jgi:hypothetical protein